jgi:hypothetical protein
MSTAKIRISSGAALWASAIVLGALIIVQAGRLTGAEARADLVSGTSGVTALTVESSSEDILMVVDNRSERLMTYKVVNQNNLELFRSYDLPRTFADARARATGGRR